MKILCNFVAVVALGIRCGFSTLAADEEHGGAHTDFSTFWQKFKSAVVAGDKAVVAEMTKFPLSMPYGVKRVKNKEDFLSRYSEIFKGEANAAQCFGSDEPHKESDRRYEIYCPFKETQEDKENAPIRFEFELTKGGWRFVGIDNINE
jgi:aminopeptidase N